MDRQGFDSIDEIRSNVDFGGTAIGSRLQQRTEYMELAKHQYMEVDSREDEGSGGKRLTLNKTILCKKKRPPERRPFFCSAFFYFSTCAFIQSEPIDFGL